jgi:hypothetical protein
MHPWLGMLIARHPHLHHYQARTHTRRHHWFAGTCHYALGPPDSVLIHHWLVMLLPTQALPHGRHPRPDTYRHHLI